MSRHACDAWLRELRFHTGIYVHVPFCLQKCPYCAFFSSPIQTPRHHHSIRSWYTALEQHIDLLGRSFLAEILAAERLFTSLFLGGGTPSLLSAEMLHTLLTRCQQAFCLTADAEISIEVNPATADKEKLSCLRQAGYNRLSIGVQSLQNTELRLLGRAHTAEQAIETVVQAKQAGFSNISLDLMYGLPGQTCATWQNTLDTCLSLPITHLSAYELTLEPGTPMEAKRDALPREEEVLAMMDLLYKQTHDQGLSRYEISNYARAGYQCRHNLNYWHNGEYLGIGPGASGYTQGQRYTLTQSQDTYIKAVQRAYTKCRESGLVAEREEVHSLYEEQECLSLEASFRETVVMGLRLTAGVCLSDLYQRFGLLLEEVYSTILPQLITQDLLILRDDRLLLTEKGLLLANWVMAELV